MLRFRINREADRQRLSKMTSWELIQDIERKAGPGITDKVMAIKTFGRIAIKLWLKGSGAKKALEASDWAKKWAPSAVPYKKELTARRKSSIHRHRTKGQINSRSSSRRSFKSPRMKAVSLPPLPGVCRCRSRSDYLC